MPMSSASVECSNTLLTDLNYSNGPHPTALIFDDNEQYGRECFTIYVKSRAQNPEWKRRFGSICFVDDEVYPPSKQRTGWRGS